MVRSFPATDAFFIQPHNARARDLLSRTLHHVDNGV
jgi:hypothetical protein